MSVFQAVSRIEPTQRAELEPANFQPFVEALRLKTYVRDARTSGEAKKGTVMVALCKQEFAMREDTPRVAKPRASRITPKEIYGFLRETQPDILARLAE